jgi:hypothetical protein
MDLRAKQLGVDAPTCAMADKFTCWQKTGRRAYASADRMNENYKTFCDKDMQVKKTGDSGYIGSVTYRAGTPDEHVFAVQLSEAYYLGTAQDQIRRDCKEAMDRVISSCDGNDDANPMNWKFGGQWIKGSNTWEVTATGKNRPWPVIQTIDGKCEGWYHGVWSRYGMCGRGWSSYDYGQQTLLPNINHCAGQPSLWKFDYLTSASPPPRVTSGRPALTSLFG